MAQMLNVSLGILIVYSAYQLTNILWNKKAAYVVTWLTALFPASILYSSITAREVWIILPFMVGLIGTAKWFDSRDFRCILIALTGFSGSTVFHGGMLLSVLIAILIFSIHESKALFKWSRKKIRNKQIYYLLLATLVLMAIFISPYVIDFLISLPQIRILSQRSFTEAIEHLWQDRASGDAAYLIEFELNNLGDFLWLCSLRTIYFLFLPFPWMIRSPIDLLGILDALFYWLACILITFKLKIIFGDSKKRNVLIIIFSMIVVFAIGTSNYGTALRHRAKFAPALFAIAGPVIKPMTNFRFKLS